MCDTLVKFPVWKFWTWHFLVSSETPTHIPTSHTLYNKNSVCVCLVCSAQITSVYSCGVYVWLAELTHTHTHEHCVCVWAQPVCGLSFEVLSDKSVFTDGFSGSERPEPNASNPVRCESHTHTHALCAPFEPLWAFPRKMTFKLFRSLTCQCSKITFIKSQSRRWQSSKEFPPDPQQGGSLKIGAIKTHSDPPNDSQQTRDISVCCNVAAIKTRLVDSSYII